MGKKGKGKSNTHQNSRDDFDTPLDTPNVVFLPIFALFVV